MKNTGNFFVLCLIQISTSLLVFGQSKIPYYNSPLNLAEASFLSLKGNSEFKKDSIERFTSSSNYENVNITNNAAPQNEPSVKISRKNPNRVVVAWRDFREGAEPAVRRVGYSYSSDGGTTWSEGKLLPPVPTAPLATDPAVTTDTQGNFYVATLLLNDTTGYGEVWVYKSTNEGETFDKTYMVSGGTYKEDKEYIATDLSLSSPYVDNLYVSWTRIMDTTGTFIRDILFSKSTDGGESWSSPLKLSTENRVQGSVPVTGPNGEIYVFWLRSTDQIVVSRSFDGGNTFDEPKVINTDDKSVFPSAGVDLSDGKMRGNIYVTWQDRSRSDDDIYLAVSSDNGDTWSDKIKVNDRVGSSVYEGIPWISINENGNLSIIYRRLKISPEFRYSFHLAISTDGGKTFNREQLSNEEFELTFINADVRFGEYVGIDFFNDRIIPVWIDERNQDYEMEIYTAIIKSPLTSVKTEFAPIKDFDLLQNYPNPFNPFTTIEYQIRQPGKVTLLIYNTLGETVYSTRSEEKPAGLHSYLWKPDNIPSGIYFYKIIITGKQQNRQSTKKMIYLK